MKLQIFITILFFCYFANGQTNLTNKIDLELLKGNYSNALKLANANIERNGVNNDIVYRKAIAQRELFEYKKALHTISSILDDSKHDKQILIEYGRLLIYNSQRDSAISVFKFIYETIDSTDVKNNTLLAKCYEKNKDYFNTERIYKQLSYTVPDNTYFRYNQAQAFVKMKNGKDAIPLLNYNLSLDSTHINSRYLLFKIYRAIEKLDIALAHMDTLKMLEPNNADWYFITAQLHYSRNHNYQAIPEIKKAMQLGMRNPEILTLFGNCLFNIKEYAQALPYLTLNGENEMEGMRLLKTAQAYYYLNKKDTAMIYFNRTFQSIMPQSFTLLRVIQGMASIEIENSNYNEAIIHLKHGIELAKNLMYEEHLILEYVKQIAGIYENNLNTPKIALELYKNQISEFSKTGNHQIVRTLEYEKTHLEEKIFFEGEN